MAGMTLTRWLHPSLISTQPRLLSISSNLTRSHFISTRLFASQSPHQPLDLGTNTGHVGNSLLDLDHSSNSPSPKHPSTFSPYNPSSENHSFVEPFWRPVPDRLSLRRRLLLYQALAKSRLSILIVLTTMASYAVYPTGLEHQGGGVTTLLATALGTFLASASANALNQILEAPMDAQMTRTRARPLVRRLLTPGHAAAFAGVSATLGLGILALVVNPVAAGLAGTTILLYVGAYTPLKRLSVTNTWIGSLVGALPPLIGSVAAAGSSPAQALTQPAAYLVPALLFAWQFPHFNALSHTIRRDYARAGYAMLANVNPARNARVGLRYALACVPLCSYAVPVYGLAGWPFAFLSLIPNVYLIIPATRFWLATAGVGSWRGWPRWMSEWFKARVSKTVQDLEAKKLFWASLIHLPSLLILMMACRT